MGFDVAITETIRKFIVEKQSAEKAHIYFLIMDSILKFVQGRYIQHFETNIKMTVMVYIQRIRSAQQ